MLDLEGRIAFASTYFCDLVGVQHEKIASMSYFDFVFSEDADVAKQILEEAKFPHGRPFRLRLRHTDGSPVWVDVQGAALQTAGGELYALSLTITGVAQVEEPLPN